MGLESTSYNVSENDVVEVCAVVYTPNISCPINFTFDIRVSTRGNDSTSDDIAGEGNTGEGNAGEVNAGEVSADEKAIQVMGTTQHCTCSLNSQPVLLFRSYAYLMHASRGVV